MESKEPWNTPEGKEVWKTESQYWVWLRGAMRRMWSDYPLRKVWKRNNLRPVTREEKAAKIFHPSTKNVGMCVFCKKWMAGSKLECDHKEASDGCTSKETAEDFLWHCGGLTGEFFQLACKPCHKIETYREKMGITFEQAVTEKEVIRICKDVGSKEWLTSKWVVPDTNEKLRKQQIRNILINQEEK